MNISLHIQHIFSLISISPYKQPTRSIPSNKLFNITLVPFKSRLNIVEKKVSKPERNSHILVNYDQKNHSLTHLDLCNIAQLLNRKCLW